MALRLTVILLIAIFVIMRFGGGPIEKVPTPEIADAPEAEAPESASEAAAATRLAPAPEEAAEEVTETVERITLEPPPALQGLQEEAAGATPAALEGFEPAPGTLISPEEALPEGFAGGGALGLGDALNLRDQVNAALDEAQQIPARPSLADLARPGGGQPLRTETAPDPEPDPQPAATAPDADAPLASVTASSVNLRGGPSTLNAVVGRVGNGEVLELRGAFSGGWVAVGHPDTGETVYIASQFLEPLNN